MTSRSASDRTVLAAIDVGTNAVRLKLARRGPSGLETLHEERDPVRPGEGVFRTGFIAREVADRLLGTLRRYAALCRRHGAQVRAVATSAVREAKNGAEIVRRARAEAGVRLEVIGGKEEARLICLGVLQGKPPAARSLCIDIGGGSTEVSRAVGERPIDLWSVSLGAVRLTELFGVSTSVTAKKLAVMRRFAAEAIEEALPRRIPQAPKSALGSSGSIRAVVSFAASEGTAHATPRQLSRAVEVLVEMGAGGRARRFDARRADIVVAGAVILEGLAWHLGLQAVTAVDAGLRDGILVDLMRRTDATEDHSLADAAVVIGRRFDFDEPHARQVARIALELFDGLAGIHRLDAGARALLETAALLHDIGNAVNYDRHHRHTQYLIRNTDIAGIADHERDLISRIARYHRRSPPLGHAGLEDLPRSEARVVSKLATLLRVADSLDRSHHQPVRGVKVRNGPGEVTVRVQRRGPVDLELWDAEHEAALFRRVFRRKLRVHVVGR